MSLRTKLALLTVLALALWTPAAAMASSDAGSAGGGELVAQDTDDDNGDNGNDDTDNGDTDTDNGTTDDGTDDMDDDTDETGVPETGAGEAAAAGGMSMMLIAGLIAFVSATAAGAFAYLRRS